MRHDRTVMHRGKAVWIAVLSAGLFLPVYSAGAGSTTETRKAYDPLVRSIAAKYALDPQFLHSIIAAESDYNRFAVSSKGALGLMQLMPQTAKDYGVLNVFDPAANIEGGAKHLKKLTALYGRRTDLVAAAYNAGRTAVDRYAGVPPYQETRDYVKKVQSLYGRTRTSPRTQIFEFRDASGRWFVTNDARLAERAAAYK